MHGRRDAHLSHNFCLYFRLPSASPCHLEYRRCARSPPPPASRKLLFDLPRTAPMILRGDIITVRCLLPRFGFRLAARSSLVHRRFCLIQLPRLFRRGCADLSCGYLASAAVFNGSIESREGVSKRDLPSDSKKRLVRRFPFSDRA